MRVADSGEYLGFLVGPVIKYKLLKKPEAKWDSRARSIGASKLAPSRGVQQYNLRAVTTMAYVAQLHPLREIAVKSEKCVVQALFHVLNNTYPIPLIFRMGDIKASQPVSLLTLSFAARYTAATETLTMWRANFDALNNCRCEHAPLDWLANQVRKVSSRAGIQSAAVQIMTLQLYPIDIAAEAARRIVMWAPALNSLPSLVLDIAAALDATKSYKPFFTLALLQTWFTGWTTSFRAHASKVSCIFGCDAEDWLLHYVVCQPLWMTIYSERNISCDIPLSRALVLQGDKIDLFNVAVTCDVYHNFKNQKSTNVLAQVRDSIRRTTMLTT